MQPSRNPLRGQRPLGILCTATGSHRGGNKSRDWIMAKNQWSRKDRWIMSSSHRAGSWDRLVDPMIQRISEGMTWYISQKDFLCSQTVITSVINLSIYLPIDGSNLLTTLLWISSPAIASQLLSQLPFSQSSETQCSSWASLGLTSDAFYPWKYKPYVPHYLGIAFVTTIFFIV